MFAHQFPCVLKKKKKRKTPRRKKINLKVFPEAKTG